LIDSVLVEKRADLPAVNAGEDQSICNDFIQLNAQEFPDLIGNWTLISGSGNIADSTLFNTNFEDIGVGTQLLVWQITDGVCPANTDTVAITRFLPPTLADAGSNQTVCDDNFVLGANFPSVGNGTWQLLSGSGNLFNPLLPFSSITDLSVGETILTWTITNGNCVSTDTLILDVKTQPIANAGFDLTICNTGSLLLQAFTPPTGEGFWDLFDASGEILNPSNPTTTVTDVLPGINTYQWIVTDGDCVSSDNVTFVVLSPSDPQCQGQGPSVFVPEGFSPNFDQINDKFEIKIPSGSQAQLKIYNRWGDLIFESANYQNEWDGFANTGRTLDDKRLPEGTYYYQLIVSGYDDPFTGFLTLWR
jgi:gliding motility-associated-like protein